MYRLRDGFVSRLNLSVFWASIRRSLRVRPGFGFLKASVQALRGHKNKGSIWPGLSSLVLRVLGVLGLGLQAFRRFRVWGFRA